MSAQTVPYLRKAIHTGKFEAAYYFHGDDEYRRDALVRDLTQRAVDPATKDFNFDLLRGPDVSAEQLESALYTPPMMADRRVVMLRDVTAIKKDSRAVLERYLARPASSTVLVMIAPSGTPGTAKGEKDVDALLKRDAVAINFPLLGEKELPLWVAQHVQETHGATITDGAIALLIEAVGSDSAQLASEIDKLTSYAQSNTQGNTQGETQSDSPNNAPGAVIDERAVSDVVGIRHGETLSDFLDRVAERDAAGALALVEHVLLLPKSGVVPIIIALTVQTLALGCGRQARDRGVPAHRMESDFFALLKETHAFPMRPWGEATKCWARNVSRWDAASIERALAALLAADRAAKDTRISSDDQLLASLVCALCTPAQRSAA